MSVSLTGYWEQFVQKLIASGRYNNQSEVIRAGLRALEEKEIDRGLIPKRLREEKLAVDWKPNTIVNRIRYADETD